MLKKLAGLTAIAGLFVMGTASAQNIANSAHDFRDDFLGSGGNLCEVCHIPHRQLTTDPGLLLWNHTETSTNFTPYTSTSLQGTSGQPAGVSKLCLGCHDGTLGADAYGGAAGTAANEIDGANFGGTAFGSELTDDHPIAITYPLTADGELQAFDTSITFADGNTGTTDDLLFGTAATETQTVECGSCHDVHNTISVGGSLLKVSTVNSALCFACHNK